MVEVAAEQPCPPCRDPAEEVAVVQLALGDEVLVDVDVAWLCPRSRDLDPPVCSEAIATPPTATEPMTRALLPRLEGRAPREL